MAEPFMMNKRTFKLYWILFLSAFLMISSQANAATFDTDSGYIKIISLSVEYAPASKSVNLHWVAEGDRRGVQYIIERSLDNKTFRMIGATKSSEDTKGKRDYYFYDSDPIGGETFYRIREIIDSNRQFITESQKINTPISTMALVQLSLSKDHKELDFAIVSPDASNINILISDVRGKIKASFDLELVRGANMRSIYTGNLAEGVYFLQVNNPENGTSVMEKFVVEE